MALNLKYISKFNSPFFKVSKEQTVFFFFWSRNLTSVALKGCTLNWIAIKGEIVRSRYSAGAEFVIGFVVNHKMRDLMMKKC